MDQSQPDSATPPELEGLTEDEVQALMLQVQIERDRAKKTLDRLGQAVENGQAFKANVLEARSLAGFIMEMMNQNTQLRVLSDKAAQALEVNEKQEKRKLWRPKRDH